MKILWALHSVSHLSTFLRIFQNTVLALNYRNLVLHCLDRFIGSIGLPKDWLYDYERRVSKFNKCWNLRIVSSWNGTGWRFLHLHCRKEKTFMGQ